MHSARLGDAPNYLLFYKAHAPSRKGNAQEAEMVRNLLKKFLSLSFG
jgi:hypothetical protein